jgi:uncharacterized protein
MTLATSGPEGIWAADVFFAANNLSRLYFLSSPDSRHARNTLAAAPVAGTIHPEAGSDWRAIRGLQLEGDVLLVPESGRAAAERVYFAKFPFAARLLQPDSDVAVRTSSTKFFALQVRRMFLVDNSLGFGNRQELDPRLLP